MRLKKRAIPIILAAALAFSLIPLLTASADDDGPKITVQTPGEPVKLGEQFDVTLELSGTDGLAGLTIEIVYDADALSIEDESDVINGSALNATDFGYEVNLHPEVGDHPIVVWYATQNHYDGIGLLLTITFKVNEDANLGNSDISVNVMTAGRLDDGETAYFTDEIETEHGSITIEADIREVEITGLVAPVNGGTPTNAASLLTDTPGVTIVSLAWNPSDATFSGDKYTATIVLTANEYYKFTSAVAATVGEKSPSSVVTSNDGKILTITIHYGGVTVTGQVRSYNPKNETTIMLRNTETQNVITATIPALASGFGQVTQVTQDFTIYAVPEGTYDLIVSKECHLNYIITGVIVETSDVDLKASTAANIRTMTLLCGDITGDGFINSSDLSIVIQPDNYDKLITAGGVNLKADLNGDGYINSSDLSIIIQPDNYDKTHVSYPYK